MIIFTTKRCLACKNLKKELNKKNVLFNEIDINENEDLFNLVSLKENTDQTPLVGIKKNGELVFLKKGKDYDNLNELVNIIFDNIF